MAYQRSEAQIMERIRNALNLADGSEGQEREAALREANRLMNKHAIDQAMLDAGRTTGERRVPTSMKFLFMGINDASWEWVEDFRTLLASIAQTNRCRAAVHAGLYNYDVTLVGMQEDVEWSQLLWMRIFMEFVSKVNPEWDLKLDLGENVARFKESGKKWDEIWAAGKQAQPDIDDNWIYDPQKCRYLMAAYKRFLRTNPDREQVGTQTFAAYRYSFVRAFVTTVSSRLEQMRADSQEQVDETSGSALALMDVSDRVDDAFYDMFPSLRPKTEEEMRQMRERLMREERERIEADRLFLASLSDSARRKVLDERAREERRSAAASEKYWREESKRQQRLNDGAGARAGRAAGQQVRIDRTSEVPQHEKKEIGG
jgi:hypothetical protein